MKITQLLTAKWGDKGRMGYTMYVLGDDGVVYKSGVKNRQHLGWIPMSGEILPANFEEQRNKDRQSPAPSHAEIEDRLEKSVAA